MSTWAHCTGIVEMTTYHTDEKPTLGNTFTFKDMMEDDFKYPDNPVPYGSEGSLHIFENSIELNKDFNELNIFTITGSLRDVKDKTNIDNWLNSIYNKYKDSINIIMFEVAISPFMGDEVQRFKYTLIDEKIICEEIK